MRRLHVKLYLMTVVVLVLFTVTVAMIWHSASIGSRMVLHGAHAVMMLGTVAAALALLAYPLVRGLTARLGRLNEGVRKFGAGDLAARVTVEGTDEVAALATSFNDSAARIEQLVRANQMLLANCSHELRTPLTRMRLAIEKLGPDGRTDAELARNIAELDALIGELLLSSRLDAAKRPDRIEPLDLLALAAEEAAHFDREVAGDPVTIAGDALLLRRLIRNLLEERPPACRRCQRHPRHEAGRRCAARRRRHRPRYPGPKTASAFSSPSIAAASRVRRPAPGSVYLSCARSRVSTVAT